LFHFVEAKNYCSRDRKERCMYEGLHWKITSVEFLLDLGLMSDALKELSKLSLDLQEHDTEPVKRYKILLKYLEKERSQTIL
jgi:hypothetical protein